MTGVKGRSGGRRANSGRHEKPGVSMRFRIDEDLVSYVKSQSNKTKFVNEAIRDKKEENEQS